MKRSDPLILFIIILIAATVANLTALYVAATVAQKKLSSSTSGNSTIAGLVGLLNSK
jgi:hypothetical protein